MPHQHVSLLLTLATYCVLAQYDSVQFASPPAQEPSSEYAQVSGSPEVLRAPPTPKWVQEAVEGSGNNENVVTDDFAAVMANMNQVAHSLGIACPIDVVFILDATSSVKGVFDSYLTYITKVIEGLEISDVQDRVGVVVFSSAKKQKLKIKLGEFNKTSSLVDAVRKLPFFSGVTSTGAALKFAAKVVDNRREDVVLNFVVLTDGFSYDIVDEGAGLLHSVPKSKVFVASLGDSFLRSELETIAGNPDNIFFGSTTYAAVVKNMKKCLTNQLFNEDIETSTVHFVKTPKDDQGRYLIPTPIITENVVIHFNDHIEGSGSGDNPRGKGINNDGQEMTFVVKKLPTKVSCKYDVALIFDASGSLVHNYEIQLKHANDLMDRLLIAPNATRVAVIEFAGKRRARVLNTFDDVTEKGALKKLISQTQFLSGTTYTNEAIKKAVGLFKETKRKDAKRVMILFTDGYSADDTSEGISELKKLGVTVHTVGITIDGMRVNIGELEEMAGSPKRFYDANMFSRLLETFPSPVTCSP
ncbi:unnamed protein product [Caenorhabditis auriculariae]|uniref:VWFA domain-containing protein n=1 Tax=Caenorhabditis auriculariae TaxID=2777116 RepID=A0A8S1GX42_9PELO|nr:unnamed protein product [Caenorhabditis auriculariae]